MADPNRLAVHRFTGSDIVEQGCLGALNSFAGQGYPQQDVSTWIPTRHIRRPAR